MCDLKCNYCGKAIENNEYYYETVLYGNQNVFVKDTYCQNCYATINQELKSGSINYLCKNNKTLKNIEETYDGQNIKKQ